MPVPKSRRSRDVGRTSGHLTQTISSSICPKPARGPSMRGERQMPPVGRPLAEAGLILGIAEDEPRRPRCQIMGEDASSPSFVPYVSHAPDRSPRTCPRHSALAIRHSRALRTRHHSDDRSASHAQQERLLRSRRPAAGRCPRHHRLSADNHRGSRKERAWTRYPEVDIPTSALGYDDANDRASIAPPRRLPFLGLQESVIEEMGDDPRLLMKAFRNVAEALGGVSEIARKANMDRVALSRVLAGQRIPRLDTLAKVSAPCGVRMRFSA